MYYILRSLLLFSLSLAGLMLISPIIAMAILIKWSLEGLSKEN